MTSREPGYQARQIYPARAATVRGSDERVAEGIAAGSAANARIVSVRRLRATNGSG